MDICMFTPSERAELRNLVGEYNQACKRLEELLMKTKQEWTQELRNELFDESDLEDDDRMYLATERLDTITWWVDKFEDQKLCVEDIEEDIDYLCHE
jgi:hypothetical protein